MKKLFSAPLILTADTTPVDGDGHGTLPGGEDQDKIRPVPMSFAEWAQSRWCADYDNSGDVTVDDFANWWSTAGLGETAWMQFNPGMAWNEEVSK